MLQVGARGIEEEEEEEDDDDDDKCLERLEKTTIRTVGVLVEIIHCLPVTRS
jgi:hypothetical protein